MPGSLPLQIATNIFAYSTSKHAPVQLAGSYTSFLKILIAGWCLLLYVPVSGQIHQADSIRQQLNTYSDKDRIKLLNALSLALAADSAEAAIAYAHQALELAKSIRDVKGQAESMYQLGVVHSAKQAPQQALDFLQKGVALSIEAKEPYLEGEGYLLLARHYQQANELRTSNECLNKALAISTNHKFQKQRAGAYVLLGANYHSLSLYETALSNFFKALNLHEALQDPQEIANDFNSIGRVYMYTKDFDDALSFFNRALEMYTTLGEESGRMKSILNIGVIHQKKGSYDSALLFYRRALPLAVQLGEESDEAKLTGNIGSTLMQQGKLAEGLAYLEQALALKESIGSYRSMLHTMNDIADVKIQMGDANGARETAEKVVQLAMEYEEGNQLRYGYQNLYRSYKKLNELEKALTYLERYDAVKDSLFGIQKAQQINQLQIQYETEKKDQAIASLQREKEIDNFRKRAYFLVGAILLITGCLLYNSQRLKTKKHKQLLTKEKEVDRLKSNFFANISHEFRTPLTLILGPLETLLTQTYDPQLRVQLGFMKDSASRLLRLINQILDLSKVDAGHLILKPKNIDVLPLVKGVTGSFSSLADSRNISLSFTADAAAYPFYCDPAHLETILINVVSNAFKFSDEGGRVLVSLTQIPPTAPSYPEGSLEISVADKGAGISQEQVGRIFERYYQVGHAAASFFGGTGIGLALTKELVQLHGGSIAVSSEIGIGTTVRICLPFGKSHFSETQVAELLEEAPAPGDLLSTFTERPVQEKANYPEPSAAPQEALPILLLIEDNADVRVYIKTILHTDYTILEAPNGEEGIEQAFERIPDLIISDVMMPKMNGYEVCRILKQDERTSHIPLILLTAKASVHSRIEGLQTEADLYLSKPFVPKELRLCIYNLIQSRVQLRERYQKQVVLKPSEVALNSVDEQFLERLMKVMETHYAYENFTVDQLSREMGMSRSQLHRKLEALTTESASQFIRTFRLQRAMALLKKNHASISEIAYKVGFASPSYFNRCFLKHYGVTPSTVLGTP